MFREGADLNAVLRSLVLLAALLAACDAKVPDSPVEAPRPVRTLVLQTQEEPGSVRLFPGELRARHESRFGFRLAGKVVSRAVQAGDRVAEGQVLARLDPSETAPQLAGARAQKLAAETDLRLAQAELGRVTDLQSRGFVSPSQVDRQQAAVDAARARVEAAEAQLAQAGNAVDYQLIRAEAPGVVTAVEAEVGQIVAAGQSVIRIARDGEREALIYVGEALAAGMRVGQPWRVRLSAPDTLAAKATRSGGKVPAADPVGPGAGLAAGSGPGAGTAGNAWLEARVREISPLAEPGTRTFAARLSLPGLPAQSPLGLSLVAEWAGGGSAIVVPATAVHSRDGQPAVWKVDENTSTVQRVEVRVGVLGDRGVAILAGLRGGDRIVTAGVQLLREGQKVRWSES